jgi:hypothetical protein
VKEGAGTAKPLKLRFGELEAILADINEIPSVQRTSFQARLKDIQRRGLLRMEGLPRGKAAAYGTRELILMAIAVEMCQFGLSSMRAVQVMLADEYPLWMAVMMAAGAIEQRPEVFNRGSADTDPDPDQQMWGFSPDWNDNRDTDPLSMFLYFDPSVLAPWEEFAGGEKGQDMASATFFYAGAGVVGDSVSRWTTGPTRRIALINVTKLVFDIAAYLVGTEGLALIKSFNEVAESIVHRGDFDLDGWLEHVVTTQGMMVAAKPERECVGLDKVVDPASEPLGRYVVPVEQVTPEGEPDYIKDRKRPDMIIRLPGQRELMVDDKVSPVADIPQRGIDWRLQELAEEPYRHRFADRTKYIVLYIPADDFLANAMAADNTIIHRALQQKVLIATPSIFRNLLVEVDKAWTKYRDEFPDIGNEEWEGIRGEHHAWLEPDYELPAALLPARLGNAPAPALVEPEMKWPPPNDIGARSGKRFAEMSAIEMAVEMGAWDLPEEKEEPTEQPPKQASGEKHGDGN